MSGRVLVFGGAGQVGLALTRADAARVAAVDRATADITAPASVAAALEAHCPAVVVNAAARTDVDGQESDRAGAFAVNEGGARVVAEACAARRLPLIHLSTDFIFDGTAAAPYAEDAAPAPLSVYGASKLAGERAVAAAHPAAVLLRVSWTFGAARRCLVHGVLARARTHGRLQGVTDEIGCPTSADGIARTLLALADRLMAGEALGGPLHWCGAPAVSRLRFIETVVAAAGLDVPVEPVPASAFGLPAQRPARAVLDTTRARDRLGLLPDDWQAALPGVVAAVLEEERAAS